MEKGNIGLVSLMLGIIGIFFAGIPFGIIAMISGFVAYRKNQRFAVAGIILGLISILLGISAFVLLEYYGITWKSQTFMR